MQFFHSIPAICLVFCLGLDQKAHCQTIKGQVQNEQKQPVSGASVQWLGTTNGVVTDPAGRFEIPSSGEVNPSLVVRFAGYKSDTVRDFSAEFLQILLSPATKNLSDVTIVKDRAGSFVSGSTTEKSEVITQKEMTKAACCDMAGCFETQATVQPQTTNVLTNSKELRILGLSGVYNQVLIDGLPMIQGTTFTYGISSYPASIIDKIYVAKGANSVLQGFESISGQINVMTRDPEKEPVLYASGYGNNFGEKHFNLNYAGRVGKEGNWKTLVGLHQVLPAGKRDRDNDGFLDLPLLNRTMVFNRWNYGQDTEEGWYTQLSFRFTKETRIGGQRSFNPSNDKGTIRAYGQTLDYLQPEFISKTGYRFNEKHALISNLSAFGQEQESYFGTLHYKASQQNLNLSLQHQWNYTESNILNSGVSFRYQNLQETIHFTDTFPLRTYGGNYATDLQVPGVFAEHTARFLDEKITWIAGARLDWHQVFGSFFTPRTMIKIDFHPQHTLKASAGSGWRQVNLFTENINLMASSRDVVFEESIKPEQAVNWGANYTWTLEGENVSGSISGDYYQIRFQNQFFPDFNTDPNKALIRNFNGKSVSNALQIESNLKIFSVWEWKLAYNYLEVYRMENGAKNVLPFNPTNRVMTALSYRPENDRWYFDANLHWFDQQRLPATITANSEAGPTYSKPYAVLNGQITHKWKQFELYGGVENIFDFRQKQPIAGWQNPFGKGFDTSTIWGPTRGREMYLGLRWKLERKEEE